MYLLSQIVTRELVNMSRHSKNCGLHAVTLEKHELTDAEIIGPVLATCLGIA